MDFTITSLGNVEFLAMILNGVAMICGTGDFARLVAIGFVVGLFFIGFQCIFRGGQQLNLHHSFLCFLCYLCMFGPSCNVVIEDAYTGQARNVDNLPLGVGVAGAAISGIGYGVTQLIEQGYGTADRTSEHQFAEPLRILNQLRAVGDEIFVVIDQELGPRANGAPSDSKSALVNYLSECTMAKIQLGGTTATELYKAPWGEKWRLTSLAHTVFLPIAGMGATETVTCNAGFDALNKIFQKFSSTAINQAINQKLHILNEAGTDVATGAEGVTTAMNSLHVTMGGAQDFVRMMVIENVYSDAAAKFYTTQQDTASAIAVNQALLQRNTQWAAEGTMFFTTSRALMAFFEGFIYAITPIVGFLIAIGTFGVTLVGKYFLTIAWIQLWLPILSILNLYIMTGCRQALTESSLGTSASFYALDTIWMETQTWIATGGMLTAATPMLALFLVTGSTYAFTTLAGRLGGQDHFNEKIQTPDAVQQSAVANHASQYSIDPTTGVLQTAAQGLLPKINISAISGQTLANREAHMHSVSDSMTAAVSQQIASGTSSQNTRQFLQQVGQQVGNTMAYDNKTVLDVLRQDSEFANLSADQQHQMIGAMAVKASAGGTVSSGLEALGNGAKVSVGGDFNASSTAQDSASSSSGYTVQFGGSKAAQHAKAFDASLREAYNVTISNTNTKQWAEMASANKETQVGDAFADMASASKSLDEAKSFDQRFGGNQTMDVAQLAEYLRHTEQGKRLAQMEREPEGRKAGLSAMAEKYAGFLGGDLEKGKIMAALTYLSSNSSGHPALQEVIQNSGIPALSANPTEVTRDLGIRGPRNFDQERAQAESSISAQRGEIARDKGQLKKVDGQAEMAPKFQRFANDSGRVNSAAKGFMAEASAKGRAQAQKGLEEMPKEGWGVDLASNVLRDGAFQFIAKAVDKFAPTAKDDWSRESWSDYFRQHQQTISGLTGPQTRFMEAVHELNLWDRNNNDIHNPKLERALDGLRQEMKGALFGDKELTSQEKEKLEFDTAVMAGHLMHLHRQDNQGLATPIVNFNNAYQLKTGPK
ncbi:conjugal transfer protein TraG N-terminal domain-containing protein [Sutterella sp.]|uniref:conjugal transfer protein TraG N-terminal domain-containing protein n=1 Tax=Sutterella sp. TaxID=1981025 RepID=UPI003FD79375